VWDLVAAVNATTSDMCEVQPIHVQVMTSPWDEQGRTVEIKTTSPNTNLCLTPKAEAMRAYVTRIFNQL